MEGKNEVVTQVNNPLTMIQAAIEKGLDLEKLEKLLELQERYEANEARKAFVKDMAEFKKNPPNIYKDKKNAQFGSKYTSLGNIVNTSTPELSKHGFSHNWQYGVAENGNPSVTCVLTHKLGHSISVAQDASPMQSKNKSGQPVTNSIQQVKSTQTYLKITTFEAVTGLVSQDANLDDDGKASEEIETIDENKIKIIRRLMDEVGVIEATFLKYLEVEKLEDLPKTGFLKAKVALEAKKKGMNK